MAHTLSWAIWTGFLGWARVMAQMADELSPFSSRWPWRYQRYEELCQTEYACYPRWS